MATVAEEIQTTAMEQEEVAVAPESDAILCIAISICRICIHMMELMVHQEKPVDLMIANKTHNKKRSTRSSFLYVLNISKALVDDFAAR